MAELSKSGVVLCKCHGKMSDRLSLPDVAEFIKMIAPELHVTIADDLCKTETLNQLLESDGIYPIVIGACREVQNRIYFWEEAKEASINPYFTKVVDVLNEALSAVSIDEAAARIKLLIWSQILRAEECKDITLDNLRVRFVMPHGKLSRRELASAIMPRYEVVPFILTSGCVGADKCNICRSACPSGAIVIDDQRLRIDTSACTNCGACVAACPHGAVSFPTSSLEELMAEIQGLLSTEVDLEPRIIAIACRGCSGLSDIDPLPLPNVFMLEIPSLAMASPALLLSAFNMGADGVALVHGGGECSSGISPDHWSKGIDFVRDFMDRLGMESKRIKTIEVDGDSESLGRELSNFTQAINELAPNPLKGIVESRVPSESLCLSNVIEGIRDKLGFSAACSIEGTCVPFGEVVVDADRCTGCGLCAGNCPTDAISVKAAAGISGFELLFRHDRCVACEMCVNICPEKCVTMNHVLDIEKLGGEPDVIFGDEYVRCRNCNAPFAPKSMINILKTKLQQAGNDAVDQIDLCPACKVAAKQMI